MLAKYGLNFPNIVSKQNGLFPCFHQKDLIKQWALSLDWVKQSQKSHTSLFYYPRQKQGRPTMHLLTWKLLLSAFESCIILMEHIKRLASLGPSDGQTYSPRSFCFILSDFPSFFSPPRTNKQKPARHSKNPLGRGAYSDIKDPFV